MPLRTRWPAQLDPAVVATVTGALMTTAVLIGPALRPGYALFLDHITVPDPARPRWVDLETSEGLRAWPLSGVAWAWSRLLPAWGLQHLILLAAVLGAGLGAGLVLRHRGWGASLSAAVLAIANPYVVERLLLGQAALLLAYAVLPWVVIASRQPSVPRRVGWASLAILPAAVTPWGAVVAGLSAVALAAWRRRTFSEVAAQAVVSAALCLPWLLPALRIGPGPGDPNGAHAFRLADDVGLGTFAAALTGGGVWAPSAQPDGRDGALGVAVTGLVVILALTGVWATARARPRAGGLLAAVWLGVPAVTALLSGPALGLWADLQSAPAVALFRDLHRLLAPSTLALALLLAVGLHRVVAATTGGHRVAAMALSVVLPLSVATMLVPGAPARLHGAYLPGPFSSEWSAALASSEAPGRVLTLPWQPLRRSAWMPQTFLDPTGKALGGRTVGDLSLSVTRDGRTIVVRDAPSSDGADDTLARNLTTHPGVPVPSELLVSSGITHILIWKGSPGVIPGLPHGWVVTFTGRDFEVWSVQGATNR